MRINQKSVATIGWIASIFATVLFLSFIDQIRLNLAGHPGSVLVPIATILNCSAWTAYGYLLEKRAWQIVLPNALGVVIGIITVVTALTG